MPDSDTLLAYFELINSFEWRNVIILRTVFDSFGRRCSGGDFRRLNDLLRDPRRAVVVLENESSVGMHVPAPPAGRGAQARRAHELLCMSSAAAWLDAHLGRARVAVPVVRVVSDLAAAAAAAAAAATAAGGGEGKRKTGGGSVSMLEYMGVWHSEESQASCAALFSSLSELDAAQAEGRRAKRALGGAVAAAG